MAGNKRIRRSGQSGGTAATRKVTLKKSCAERGNRYSREKASVKIGAFFSSFGRRVLARIGARIGFAGRIFVGIVCIFGVLLAVAAGLLTSYTFFTHSQYFAVKTIEIKGNYRLKSRELLEAAGLQRGMNSLALSIRQMEKKLVREPWVKGLSIKRILPDAFEISISERVPYYWVNVDGVLFYADAYGRAVAPVTAGSDFASLPALEIESGAEYLARLLPALSQDLSKADFPLDTASASWVRLSASRNLELGVGGVKLIIGLDGWNVNLRRLGKVLHDLSRRGELRQVKEVKASGKDVWVMRKV